MTGSSERRTAGIWHVVSSAVCWGFDAALADFFFFCSLFQPVMWMGRIISSLSATYITNLLLLLLLLQNTFANSVRLSVRPSVCHTRVLYQNGWTYHRNSFTVWYAHRSSFSSPRVVAQIWRFHPQRGHQVQGGSNFWPICSYISEALIDRGIVTMEDEYKVVYALSNGAIFDDLEWPRTPVSRSQYSLKVNILQTVHRIHLMFGSRQGFSGSTLFPVW